MSKKLEKTITPLPSLPYVNSNRLEEAQNKIVQDKNFIDKLKEEIYSLKNEIHDKERQYIHSTKIYDKILDDKSKQLTQYEDEIKKLKAERKEHQQKLKEEYEEKITQIKEAYDNRIIKITEELERYKEKQKKSKNVKKEMREDIEGYKKEIESKNATTIQQIQAVENKMREMQEIHDKELTEMKRREEEFIKSNEELMDTDLYIVYKEIKKKFENKLSDLMESRAKNEKILDENKLFKLNLDNSENIIQKCSLMQVNQKKIIKHLKEQLEDKTNLLNEAREEFERSFKEMTANFEDIINQKDSDLKRLKENLNLKNKENSQLRFLSQMILDQRSEIEIFFIESLEEVKMEIYKRKKEMEKKNKNFPYLNKKYEEKSDQKETSFKVDIKELSPEDREKVLRLLFGKINENYKPKTYKNHNLLKNSKENFSDSELRNKEDLS